MTATPLRELLRQALEAGCDLEEVQEMVGRGDGPVAARELAAILAGDDADLAMLAAGAMQALDWEWVRPALLSLDPIALAPAARTFMAMCFIEGGEEPPFTLTRRDLLAGFAAGIEHMSEGDIDEFLEDVGATPEELEEVLGSLVVDADEWGRSKTESTPLGRFRQALADELADLAPTDRGAHLDTAYLVDDYLDGWSDCHGPEEITFTDLLGFAGWYLIAHTSASPRAISEHLERLPRIIEVIDRHYDTRLARAWAEESGGLAEEITRALEVSDLLSRQASHPHPSTQEEEGHWELTSVSDTGVEVRRLGDGQVASPVLLDRDTVARLRPGDVLNLVLGHADAGWAPLEAGPAYPARVAPLFHRAAQRSG